MSLHAAISPEAQKALDAQKKNSTIFALITSVLGLFLIGLILYVINLAIVEKETPEMVGYGNNIANPDDQVEEIVETEQEVKPAAPTSTAAKVISAITSSPTAVPTPTFETADLSMDFGADFDFGESFDTGSESSGGAGGFGSPNKIAGTIGGKFYDFKQTREGEGVSSYVVGENKHYVRRISKFQRHRFSAEGLSQSFVADKELFIRYIAIPPSRADSAPRFFGVQDQVEPSGWLVHYSGKIKAPKTGRFRFVGKGDDYLSVAINNRPRLIAAWSDIADDVKMGGANSSRQPDHPSPFAEKLVYGRWFDVEEGEELDLDIAIGENPGGLVGFILLIEEKGVEYTKDENENPILPPFTVGKLQREDLAGLRSYPKWTFDLENVPVFETVD